MNYRIKKISQDLPEDHEPSEDGLPPEVVDSDSLVSADADASEDDFSLMSNVLEAVSRGIKEGFNRDFSNSSGSVGNAITDVIFRGLGLMLGTSGDLLQRQIKNESSFEFDNTKINENSKKALRNYVINPSRTIYADYFSRFMTLVKGAKSINTDDLNIVNTGNEALIIEYTSADNNAWTSSDKSPYKIVLKKIIPLLRAKFDAIASFKEKVGAGGDIDHRGVGFRFASGNPTDDDILQVQGLYRAIADWDGMIQSLSGGVAALGSLEKSEGTSSGPADGTSESSDAPDGPKLPSFDEVVNGISIHNVRPRSGAVVGDNPGQIIIKRDELSPVDVPVVTIGLRGSMAKYVKPVGSDARYFKYFLKQKIIKMKNTSGLRPHDYISNVSSESVLDGAELTIYFNPSALKAAIGSDKDLVRIMEVDTTHEHIEVVAKSSSKNLEKTSGFATTPQYEATSPGGDRVVFTPADLVRGGGYITDSNGKKFKPTKRKGKSLADRVMSPSFGKVRRKKK